jgi:uncharacterized protein YjbJ (UPF0337 family)
MVRAALFRVLKEVRMNEDTLKGQWTQLKGKVREKWGKLTNDDIEQIQGKGQQLVGKIQERYGIARDEAQRQYDEWLKQHPVDAPRPVR